MTHTKPVVLIILDGWGYRLEKSHNPTQNVPTPTFDDLFSHYPMVLLEASGEAVGLPPGQMGNSEVGHLHLGSGRKCPQDLVRINQDIQHGTFKQNPAFLSALSQAREKNSAIHVMGLLSPGGVHSHENQIIEMLKLIGEHGIQKNYFHALLDGRDTPPQSAMNSIRKIDALYQTIPGQIVSICGRYFAMDRDKRWDRTQKMYDLMTLGAAAFTETSAETALLDAYARNETDEFVEPTLIKYHNDVITVNDNDIIIFMNYRADRARQLTAAFTESDFHAFKRTKIPLLSRFITLTQYTDTSSSLVDVAYPPISMQNTLGQIIENANLSQLRLAETEKYAHVTYFFNGGIEAPFQHEVRHLIPSPKIATYDLKPEMNAAAVTDALVEAIHSQKYALIVCNYANPDMLGHTGVESAAEIAVAVMDECIARVMRAAKESHTQLCITADHGNIELMYDEINHQPHTAHTTNLVPFVYVGDKNKIPSVKIGALDDVAPTVLYLMNLSTPAEMTGHVLLKARDDNQT